MSCSFGNWYLISLVFWSSSIMLYNKNSIAHNHHTNNNLYISTSTHLQCSPYSATKMVSSKMGRMSLLRTIFSVWSCWCTKTKYGRILGHRRVLLQIRKRKDYTRKNFMERWRLAARVSEYVNSLII